MAAADGVRITQREIYDKLLDVERKVDVALAGEYGKRISRLEKLVWSAPPALLLGIFGLFARAAH